MTTRGFSSESGQTAVTLIRHETQDYMGEWASARERIQSTYIGALPRRLRQSKPCLDSRGECSEITDPLNLIIR
jgi:hypothetical protein